MPFVYWRRGTGDPSTNPANNPIGKNVLELKDVRESANFTCIANSKLGTKEAHTQVIVQSLPRAPTNVRVSDVTPTSVRISWSYDIGAENIIYFVVQYKQRNAQAQLAELSGITTYHQTIHSLVPYTEYEFYVIAVNAIGRGPPSAPVYASTGESGEFGQKFRSKYRVS